MNKPFYLLLYLLLLSQPLFSQTKEDTTIYIGQGRMSVLQEPQDSFYTFNADAIESGTVGGFGVEYDFLQYNNQIAFGVMFELMSLSAQVASEDAKSFSFPSDPDPNKRYFEEEVSIGYTVLAIGMKYDVVRSADFFFQFKFYLSVMDSEVVNTITTRDGTEESRGLLRKSSDISQVIGFNLGFHNFIMGYNYIPFFGNDETGNFSTSNLSLGYLF